METPTAILIQAIPISIPPISSKLLRNLSPHAVCGVDWFPRSPLVIYDQFSIDPDFLTINHRGYVFAHISGIYTFSTASADDITELWVGNIAYSGWDRGNLAIDQPFEFGPMSIPVQFSAGI